MRPTAPLMFFGAWLADAIENGRAR